MRNSPVTGPGYAAYKRFAALDQEFHDVLAAAVGCLHAHLHMCRLGNAPDVGRPTVAEHERVLRAVLRRSPERAAEAMETHLRSSRERHGAGTFTSI